MWVYLFALIVAVGTWYLVKHLSQQEDFLKKPIAEQQEIKKKILWGVFGGLAIGCILAWLMQSGITSWVRYLVVVVYLLIWAGAVYLFWLSYVIGIQKDTAKIKKSDGKLFKNPQKYLKGFAVTNLICACSIMLIAIAIPLIKIDIESWGALLFAVLAIRNFVETRFERLDGSENS